MAKLINLSIFDRGSRMCSLASPCTLRGTGLHSLRLPRLWRGRRTHVPLCSVPPPPP
jgi:hypothetical protein